MRVLVACEESQRVCISFRERGHEAYSCDIVECSGGHPEWHIQGDVLPILNGRCEFRTADGELHKIDDRWDLIIAHPPCTYLTVTGNRWFDIQKYGDTARKRYERRNAAIVFFMRIVCAHCDRIAVENPVGVMSTAYRKPDQIIQPYMFGDPREKRTCIWLKGLPPLFPTDEVAPPERKVFESGTSMAAWYANMWNLPRGTRSKLRSKTPWGVARAMAEQWG